jgi:predicted DNA-binding transcriptional regulator AlpA
LPYQATDKPPGRYLTVRQVAARYDVGVATVWRWSALRSEFPKPVKLGPGCTRWCLSDLVAFESTLGAQS